MFVLVSGWAIMKMPRQLKKDTQNTMKPKSNVDHLCLNWYIQYGYVLCVTHCLPLQWKRIRKNSQFRENIYKSNLQYVFAIYYVIEERMLEKSTMNIRMFIRRNGKKLLDFRGRKKERKKNVIKNRI